MRELLKRSISGTIYVLLFLASVLYSKDSFIILATAFGLCCIWEFAKLLKTKIYVAFLFFIGYSLLVFFDGTGFEAIPFLLAIALSGSLQVLWYLFSSKTEYPYSTFQKEDISLRYVAMSMLFLILLPFFNGSYEPYIILYLLLLIWTNDSFAFLVGVNFGKNKLFEKVSPKKTKEGFFGGVFFTLIMGVLISRYSELFSLIDWVVLSLMASVLGTLGDLVESKFKRRAKIKDSGNIMPGHGGLLDRLDSLLFVSPFVYLYIHFII